MSEIYNFVYGDLNVGQVTTDPLVFAASSVPDDVKGKLTTGLETTSFTLMRVPIQDSPDRVDPITILVQVFTSFEGRDRKPLRIIPVTIPAGTNEAEETVIDQVRIEYRGAQYDYSETIEYSYEVLPQQNFCSPPTIDTVTTTNTPTQGSSQGQIAITLYAGDDVYDYSIDGGATFQDDSTFLGLPAGDYNVVVRNKSDGCRNQLQVHNGNPVTVGVDQPNTPETPYTPRVQIDYKDELGGSHQVVILDRDYTGAVDVVSEVYSEPFEVNWTELDDIPFQAQGSEAIVRLISGSNFEYEFLYTSDERRFQVEKYIDNGAGMILEWKGWVLPDQFQEPYVAPRYVTEIYCGDGLGTLEGFRYQPGKNNAVISEPIRSVKDILVDILTGQIGLNIGFLDYVNITEQRLTDDVNVTSLDKIFIDYRSFLTDDGRYLSSAEVIERICQSLGLLIRQSPSTSSGDRYTITEPASWVIISPSGYRDTTFYRRMNPDGTMAGSNQVYGAAIQIGNQFHPVDSDQILRTLGAFKQARTVFNTDFERNLLAGGEFEADQFNQAGDALVRGTLRKPNFLSASTADVRRVNSSLDDSEYALELRTVVDKNSTPNVANGITSPPIVLGDTANNLVQIKFRYRVPVSDEVAGFFESLDLQTDDVGIKLHYQVSLDARYYNTAANGSDLWTRQPSSLSFNVSKVNEWVEASIDVALPASSGNGSLRVSFLGISEGEKVTEKDDGTINRDTITGVGVQLDKVAVEYLVDGNYQQGERTVTGAVDGVYTQNLDDYDIPLGDAETRVAYNGLLILDGQNIKNSATWRRYDLTENKPLQETILDEIFTLRGQTIRQIEGTFRGYCYAQAKVETSFLSGRVFIFAGGQYLSRSARWNVQLRELASARKPVTFSVNEKRKKIDRGSESTSQPVETVRDVNPVRFGNGLVKIDRIINVGADFGIKVLEDAVKVDVNQLSNNVASIASSDKVKLKNTGDNLLFIDINDIAPDGAGVNSGDRVSVRQDGAGSLFIDATEVIVDPVETTGLWTNDTGNNYIFRNGRVFINNGTGLSDSSIFAVWNAAGDRAIALDGSDELVLDGVLNIQETDGATVENIAKFASATGIQFFKQFVLDDYLVLDGSPDEGRGIERRDGGANGTLISRILMFGNGDVSIQDDSAFAKFIYNSGFDVLESAVTHWFNANIEFRSGGNRSIIYRNATSIIKASIQFKSTGEVEVGNDAGFRVLVQNSNNTLFDTDTTFNLRTQLNHYDSNILFYRDDDVILQRRSSSGNPLTEIRFMNDRVRIRDASNAANVWTAITRGAGKGIYNSSDFPYYINNNLVLRSQQNAIQKWDGAITTLQSELAFNDDGSMRFSKGDGTTLFSILTNTDEVYSLAEHLFKDDIRFFGGGTHRISIQDSNNVTQSILRFQDDGRLFFNFNGSAKDTIRLGANLTVYRDFLMDSDSDLNIRKRDANGVDHSKIQLQTNGNIRIEDENDNVKFIYNRSFDQLFSAVQHNFGQDIVFYNGLSNKIAWEDTNGDIQSKMVFGTGGNITISPQDRTRMQKEIRTPLIKIEKDNGFDELSEKIDLFGGDYTLGVQSSGLYFRSTNDFNFYRGGSHNDNRQNPGGGDIILSLKQNDFDSKTVGNFYDRVAINAGGDSGIWFRDNDQSAEVNNIFIGRSDFFSYRIYSERRLHDLYRVADVTINSSQNFATHEFYTGDATGFVAFRQNEDDFSENNIIFRPTRTAEAMEVSAWAGGVNPLWVDSAGKVAPRDYSDSGVMKVTLTESSSSISEIAIQVKVSRTNAAGGVRFINIERTSQNTSGGNYEFKLEKERVVVSTEPGYVTTFTKTFRMRPLGTSFEPGDYTYKAFIKTSNGYEQIQTITVTV